MLLLFQPTTNTPTLHTIRDASQGQSTSHHEVHVPYSANVHFTRVPRQGAIRTLLT